MVDLLLPYSNRTDLLDDLSRVQAKINACTKESDTTRHSVRTEAKPPPQPRKLEDRLGSEGISHLVACFEAGMIYTELAERFATSESTLKRLLRKLGLSRNERTRSAT